ncbi:Fic family protein [Luteimonas sp. R10]|uniref:Fic family protein n=1 Tax=Luteimonas sp. R10 TaxID=3108176 RepID=UPI0030904A0C|nr:Fic family protein [Luteimonas sp. R10]
MQRNRLEIVDHLFPGSVVSHRSAIEIGAALQPHLFVFGADRQGAQPGIAGPDREFKLQRNRAGNSVFVEPELVAGTQVEAFALYRALPHALARAIFMQVAVSEVHPFDDGNGRLSRAMMSAELTAANECRIIIPTVYRDDYITTLKAFSRTRQIDPVIRMFELAQAFTASMDYTGYDAAKASFTAANAFENDRDAQLQFQER